MRLTVNELRRIIKEEVSRMLVMEAGYEDPWEEENPKYSKYYDPRFGDEPPGYKPPKAKGARKIKIIDDFQTWLDNYVTDPKHTNRKSDNRLLRAQAATEGRRENFYTMKDGKLYLKPELYDAIENERVEMKALKALVPGGVERGLPEAGGSP